MNKHIEIKILQSNRLQQNVYYRHEFIVGINI